MVSAIMPGSFHRPRGEVCIGCNGQYFAASLPIHQKTCFQRNGFVEIACPVCRCIVRTCEYHAHVSGCTGPVQQQPQIPRTAGSLKAPVPFEELNPAEPDGRVRCKRCDRAFLVDRIAKHQAVCIATKRGTKERDLAIAPPPRAMTPGRRRRSPKRVMTDVLRSTGIHQIKISLSGTTGSSGRENAIAPRLGTTWGREMYKDSKQFDPIHRDAARHASSGCNGRVIGGSSLSLLSHATATSAGNPLATSRFMTQR